MRVIIREPTQGLIVWQGNYPTDGCTAAALADYRKDLGAEASDYDAVDPNWTDKLEITTD